MLEKNFIEKYFKCNDKCDSLILPKISKLVVAIDKETVSGDHY